MIVAIQTARKGSKSVRNKNISIVNGDPLFLHSLDIANQTPSIQKVYSTTDCPVIKSFAKTNHFDIIDRPENLAGDSASHHDTMIHAILEIEKIENTKLDLIVFLLGNTISAEPKWLEACIQKMIVDDSIDSIQSVSKFNMFNPYRAFRITADDRLKTIVDSEGIQNSNDKNAAGDIWFNNGSFFICRRDIVLSKKGASPFPWLGYNILPFRESVKMEVDAPWQLEWLRKCYNEQ